MAENAPSQLVLYHYSDLQKDKDIVLMTAEMDGKFIVSRIFTVKELGRDYNISKISLICTNCLPFA